MSTLKVTSIQNPSTSSGGVSIDTSGHVTVDGVVMPSSGPLSNRNKIINGDMRIDQRNAGASVSGTAVYPVDRFRADEDTDGATSCQQVSDAPAGFNYSLKLTTTTADASLGAAQFCRVIQRIEGYQTADFGWGTADAKTVTLSFWVKSSLTGTFGGALSNSAANRGYGIQYTISSANTWEYKTITIPGDTSGTWLTTNGIGIRLDFGLGIGTDYSTATAGSWTAASNAMTTTTAGLVSLIGTLNATWQITGVQLEAGSVATPFEHRSYGDELARCQRYYQKLTGFENRHYVNNVMRSMVPLTTVMRDTPIVTKSYTYVTGLNADNTNARATHLQYDLQHTGGGTGVIDLGGGTITLTAEL